jgi:hypothetical protein
MPKWLKLTLFFAIFFGVPIWIGNNSTLSKAVAFVLAIAWWAFMLTVVAPWLDRM